MPLGFEPSNSLNNPIDKEFRQYMASSLQQLGNQVSEGIKQIATNRQLRQMGDELKQVQPDSPYFPQEMVGVVTRYPLAVSDPRGTVALNLLGNAHKNWITTKLKTDQSTQKPLVRNFSDKTSRQYNPETKEWEVITEAPLPTKQVDNTQKLQKLFTARRGLVSDLEKAKSNLGLVTPPKGKAGEDWEGVPTGLGGLAGIVVSQNAGTAKRLQEQISRIDNEIKSIESSQPQMNAEVFTAQEEMPLQGGGGPTPLTAQAVNPEALIPVQPRSIDRATAAEFLKKSGGDRNRARELAKQTGFSF